MWNIVDRACKMRSDLPKQILKKGSVQKTAIQGIKMEIR